MKITLVLLLLLVAQTSVADEGIRLAQEGKLDEAIVEFSKSIEREPKLADHYFNRGPQVGPSKPILL